MDGLYSYFRSMVLGSASDHQDQEDHGPPEQTRKPTDILKKQQHRYFTGIVTSLNEVSGTGMIDKNVFFEFDAIIGGLRPAVGVSVHVSASREHVHAGWRAQRVEITSKWKPESKSEIEVVTGYVSRMSGGVGVIDCTTHEVMFSTEDVVSYYKGYQPHINDWVKVTLLHQDDEIVVNEIQPLRSQTVTGTISSVSHGFGSINSDIYFTFSSCCNGYHPRKGDTVSVECVEYNHHKSNWRASKVEPTAESQRTKTVTSARASSNGAILPAVPIIGSGKYIQLDDQSSKTTETKHTLHENTTRPYHSSYSTRIRGNTNLRGDYHTKLAACRIPGQRPLRPHPLRLSKRLDFFPVPDYLRACVNEEKMDDVVITEPSLGEPLCMENYQDRFSSLLYLEEIQREIDIRQFDMYSVSLRRCGSLLSLCVPGLAEGRPSLLVGDRVIVCEEGGDDTCPHWEGYIHEVRSGDILIMFANVFHDTYDNQDVDIMFAFNRTPLRRMHHVVRMCPSIGPSVLFPGQPSPKPPLLTLKAVEGRPNRSNPDQKWFNPALNARQRAAVVRIVGGQCRPAPYILFGPPGTGKTVTLVEAVLQVHRLSTGSRILACTPSNSAADLIAQRLHQSGQLRPGEMVRLNAIQRSQTPPACVEPYCMDTDSADIAIRSRIIIATCMTAGFLHSLGLRVGHFTHVFIDEAGQATEPESLLAISLLAETDGQTILAGDPCQLGPVLSSGMADSYGLGLSLLERLMERPAYQRDEAKFADHGSYDPLMVTKLVDNYRSHVSLLELYSRMFYHEELQPKAPTSLTHTMEKWEELPNKGFPLIFHGVQGEDMQEGNSPSWFNPVEALQVAKYIQALKDNSTYAPMLENIGVVTPYRKQVEKVRLLLQKIGAKEVKVGSVEEFQGQERTAIIISTVRSTTELLDFDAQHHLGFLSNPKRFNVAISRAQALLVVIGNPLLLSQDPCWSTLIRYAVHNRAYTGCPLP